MNRAQKRDQVIENLEKFRSQHGWTNTHFASLLGVKRQQWERWRNGRMGMRLATAHGIIETLARAMGNSWKLRDFVGDEPPKDGGGGENALR